MGELYHDLSQPSKNHVSYGLRYPNQAAMELGTGELDGQTLEDRHIGKTARVMDTNRRFMLLAHDPDIIWAPEDAGALLLADLDIHLAPGGDDATGDGTSGNPYKTFDRAFQVIENKRINKRVKIHPAAGVYDSFPSIIFLDIEPGGELVIDASGEAYPIVSGPYTVGTITGVGVQNPFGNYEATDLTPNAAPSWTPDEFYGKFLHFKTGNYANRVLNLWSNDVTTVRTMMDLFTFQVGDTFDIVNCPVKIEVDHPIRFVGRRVGSSLLDYFSPQVVFAGIHIESDIGNTNDSPLSYDGLSVVMTYSKLVDMWTADNFSIPLGLKGSKFNLDFLATGILDNTELEEWINYSWQIQSLAETSPTEEGVDVVLYDSEYLTGIGGAFCRRYIFQGGVSGYLSFCFAGGFVTFLQTSGVAPITSAAWLNVVYIEQKDYDAPALLLTVANINILEAYIEKCGQPIILKHNSFLQADWLHGNTINAAWAAQIGPASSIYIPIGSRVTLLGTSGAIEWDFDGAVVAAWPAAGNFVQKVDSFVSTKT
jgi:hypothetical protein